MPDPTALDVANYFLAKRDSEAGDDLSNLKIQKLVYYAQGIHLALTGKPLFRDPIEAWTHGPVVKSVYDQFKQHADRVIPTVESTAAESVFTEEQRDILDEVYSVYGQFSPWKLRDLTHEEAPWRDANASPDYRKVISHEDLLRFFKTRVATGGVDD